MVERVPIASRCRIRRAWMADSWIVGILYPDGLAVAALEKSCCGEGSLEAVAREARSNNFGGKCMVGMYFMCAGIYRVLVALVKRGVKIRGAPRWSEVSSKSKAERITRL